MPEHVGGIIVPSVIPEGLRKRWEQFAKAVRKSWEEVHKEGLKGIKAFERFWNLMSRYARAGVHLMSVEEAMKYGVKAHPICVLAKMARGLSRREAEEQCKKEGKFHGISLLRAEIEKHKLTAEQAKELAKMLEEAGLP